MKVNLLNDLKILVKGFADTLTISKMLLKERTKEKKTFLIASLAHDFLPSVNTDSLHNAVDDINMLQKIIRVIGINEETVKNQAKAT